MTAHRVHKVKGYPNFSDSSEHFLPHSGALFSYAMTTFDDFVSLGIVPLNDGDNYDQGSRRGEVTSVDARVSSISSFRALSERHI